MSIASRVRYIAGIRASRKRIRDEKMAKQRVVDNEHGALIVTRTRRAVRITAARNTPLHQIAFIDLTDDQVDRLIQRLTALRGGKRALP